MAGPIKVSAGDLLGLWSPVTTGQPLCYFGGQSLIADTVVALGPLSGAPVPGEVVPLVNPDPEAGVLLDLAATFVPITDVGVATTAGPANAIVGEPALLSSTVTNGDFGSEPVTFIDAVPAPPIRTRRTTPRPPRPQQEGRQGPGDPFHAGRGHVRGGPAREAAGVVRPRHE